MKMRKNVQEINNENMVITNFMLSANRRLFHGSQTKGLNNFIPSVNGHGRKALYATTEKAFAAIFINRPGGSLEAAWGRYNGIPYYCERIANVFDKNYSNVQGSIYEFAKESFVNVAGGWEDEYISDCPMSVINELQIYDAKQYMIELAKLGEFIIIPYSNRFDYFPHFEDDFIMNCIDLLNKYGGTIINDIIKYHPAIGDKIISLANRNYNNEYSNGTTIPIKY